MSSKHAMRVWRPQKTRSKASAGPEVHPGFTVEEPHSAGITPRIEHDIAPAPRATLTSAAASSGAAHEVATDRTEEVLCCRSSCLLAHAVGCSISCHSDKAWEVMHLGP